MQRALDRVRARSALMSDLGDVMSCVAGDELFVEHSLPPKPGAVLARKVVIAFDVGVGARSGDTP